MTTTSQDDEGTTSRLDRLQEIAERQLPTPNSFERELCSTDDISPSTILSLIATVRGLIDKGAFQFANECWGCGIDQRLLNLYGHADDCPYKVAVAEWT